MASQGDSREELFFDSSHEDSQEEIFFESSQEDSEEEIFFESSQEEIFLESSQEEQQEEMIFDIFSQGQISWVAETLYFRYRSELDEGINLDNLGDILSLDMIPLRWIDAWEIDGRRGLWAQTIVKDNLKLYTEFSRQWGDECAREMVNNYRKYRIMKVELCEEIERVALEGRNQIFEDEEARIMENHERRIMGA